MPASSLAQIESQCARTWSRSCFVVIPSMPGAPSLRMTARQATVAFSRLTTCSISASCIAFCVPSRRRTPLAVHSHRFQRLLRLGDALPVQGGDRGCHALLFRATARCVLPASVRALLFRSSALRSVRLFVRAHLKRYYGLW